MAKTLTIGGIITGLFALLVFYIQDKVESPVTAAMMGAGQEAVNATPLDPAMKGSFKLLFWAIGVSLTLGAVGTFITIIKKNFGFGK